MMCYYQYKHIELFDKRKFPQSREQLNDSVEASKFLPQKIDGGTYKREH